MAHVMVTADPGSPLLAVAAELRQKIYGMLFEGSQLWLQSYSRRCKISDNILELLRFFKYVDTNILKVCRTTLYEAQTVLAKETLLSVSYLTDRENPLDNIPDWFLSNTSLVELEVDSFVHVQRGRLTSLQQVTLVNEAPGPGSSLNALDMYDGIDDETFVRAVMDDILSWEWKKEQFIYLAKEEGWRLTLKTRWYSFMNGNTYLEIETDLTDNDRVIAKRGVVRDKEMTWAAWGDASNPFGDTSLEDNMKGSMSSAL